MGEMDIDHNIFLIICLEWSKEKNKKTYTQFYKNMAVYQQASMVEKHDHDQDS